MSESTLRIGVLFPEVLGTYGDTGNALILKQRALWRGIDAELVPIHLDHDVPVDLDMYLLGGGEDVAQVHAAQTLNATPSFKTAVNNGTPLLAICAGLQILGEWYVDGNGREVRGLGMLDVTTRPQGFRTIGELVSEPMVEGLDALLTGFENHGGATKLGQDARPLGRVLAGHGNSVQKDDVDSEVTLYDGVAQGSILATYMHGPALARNPQLADLLIERAVGEKLVPIGEHALITALRHERISHARVQ